MANKKKIATAAVSTTLAASLLLGGTFAWQSISQTALNEKEAVVNPGGRLHDDFDGTNKDVYVENFAENDIYARVRLDEYFEVTMNKGVDGVEKTEIIVGTDKDDTTTYETHIFGGDNTTDGLWNWTTGGSTTYMPTFNMNKDSLVADINGTMDYEDGEGNADPYGDYVDYTLDENKTKTGTEIYDGDTNSVDEVGTDFDNLATYAENIKTIENKEHTATATGTATLISMAEWLALNDGTYSEATHSNYWVYDTDGWVYYSSPIEGGTATGLLLDSIELMEVMDDSYYYAINVVAQFITADDLGKDDNTGFYADGETVSDNALTLLEKIGVTVSSTTAGGGDNTNSIFTQSMVGTTETVTIDGVEFYVLAYDEANDSYMIWAKDSVGDSKFDEGKNVWNETCIAYQTLVTWLEGTETLKNYAQETTIYTRASATDYENFNTMNCSVFLLSEADVFGTVDCSTSIQNMKEYTYQGQLVTNSEIRAGNCESSVILRSPYTRYGVACINPNVPGADEAQLYYSGELLTTSSGVLRPALWVKGL